MSSENAQKKNYSLFLKILNGCLLKFLKYKKEEIKKNPFFSLLICVKNRIKLIKPIKSN